MKPLLVLILPAILPAVTPTQSDFARALDRARIEWGYNIQEIQVRLDPLNACNLRAGEAQIANIQVTDTQTTLHFTTDGEETGTETSHHFTYVILINSNCDWSRLSLDQTILHEYGHVLAGAGYHSGDKESIMYPVITGKQRIMEEDRDAAGRGK